MSRLRWLAAFAPVVLAVPALAQDPEMQAVRLRVSASASGAAVEVDRGRSDGLRVGDDVVFTPRTGGTYRGVVVSVGDRSAIVELREQNFVPSLGTRGEVRVPVARFEAGHEEPVPEPVAEEPEHPGWDNPDEGWDETMPLLAQVQPVRPEDRNMKFAARLYAAGAVTHAPEDGFSSSLLRAGVDMTLDNPFGRGGSLRADTEFNYLTESDDQVGTDVLVRRLSYAWGGTRFENTRWEVGRFLQHGMPEFGVLDGVEWGQRRDNGDRLGASFGYLPELDEDFESLEDLQLAGYYIWSFDERDDVTFGLGFQKTLHNGKTDRDLLILKSRARLESGWDLTGKAWIDFYYGRDDLKGGGVEVTQGLASAHRQWSDGTVMDFTFTHRAYPETLRREFVPPVLPNELADNHYERLAWDTWLPWGRDTRLHTNVAGWVDEDDHGAAVELGIETEDWLAYGGQTDISAFGTAGEFVSDIGVRAAHARLLEGGRWDFFYEVKHSHQRSFPNDADDFLQHRLRANRLFYSDSGFDLSLYAEAHLWDDEFAWSIGFHFQKNL